MVRNFALCILTLLLFSKLAFGQELRDGIYLAQEKDAPICLQKLPLMNSKTFFCLPLKPFISTDDFKHVSEIVYDSQYDRQYFTVSLTVKAAENLNTIVAMRPDIKLALVVNGKLINLLDVSGRRKVNRFNIYEALNSHELSWIHNSLKSSMKVQEQEKLAQPDY